MTAVFPFAAIVGQDALKRALILGALQPQLGGVLIRGTKGVAKSTAVRALARLLPNIETLAGCPFQRSPGERVADWPLPDDTPVIARPAPLIELPLGATEDRVLGALHLEKALRGQRAFDPGLLAAANRGILYVDEVNLLPDHLVDILLDAAASGVHRLEREGLSLVHPARFLLVGTMNPEEGDLRPQLLDRFGLAVDVGDLSDAAGRAEAVRRRLAFEADPDAFAAQWQGADAALAARIAHARRLLPEVRVSDDLLHAISERCLAAGVEGLRADLTVCRSACAWAAYQDRREVQPADVDAVAELALAHRRGPPPEPPPQRGPRNAERPTSNTQQGNGETGSAPLQAPSSALVRDDIAGVYRACVRPPAPTIQASLLPGRWRKGGAQRRGANLRSARAVDGTAVDWAATLRAAALHQHERGRSSSDEQIVLRADDLRYRRRREPAGCLLLFVVDASGSMAAWRRMRQTKAAIGALLRQAYQHRDRIAMLTFRGTGAEVVLPPTCSLARAWRALEELAVGGTTPLAHGLVATRRFVQRQQQCRRRVPIWTVILTDGRCNVAYPAGRAGGVSPLFPQQGADAPRSPSGDSWEDALQQARALAHCGSEFLVVDTETGWPRFGRAAQLAAALVVACRTVEQVLGSVNSHRSKEIAS